MKKTFTLILVLLLLLAGIKNANAQCSNILYRDADGDGYGNPNISITRCFPVSGYVSNNLDCDDSNHKYNLVKFWYLDADGDGYGNPAISVSSCSPPQGYVEYGYDELDDNPRFLNFYGDDLKTCFPPSKNSFVKHYADCSLNEADTIQIVGAGWYVELYNTEGTMAGFTNVSNGSLVGVPPGWHARIRYKYDCWSTNPNEALGESWIDEYEDFYFEKCTNISGEDTVCAGGAVTLTAQKDVESVFAWYDAKTGGNLLQEGSVYQSPALATGQYRYWVSADGGPRRSFTVTSLGSVINNKPGNISVAANTGSCSATVNFRNPYTTDFCKGATSEAVFRGTGAYQTWVVPQNIYSVNIDAVGARSGGAPGRVQTTLAVTPGETLYINVANGSYPNGGTGATETMLVEELGWSWTKRVSGGNGGGSTQVGRTGNLLTDTLVIAGGGGGNAYRWLNVPNELIGSGGNGGYVADADPGQPNFMQGMSEQPDYDITDMQVGGGGGGGYYGGLTDILDGDGASPGQGGGSHIAVNGTSNTVFTQGYGGDHSYVRITYVKEFPMMQIAGLPSGSAFPLGTTTNTFKYTNSNGVETTTSFDVSVTGTMPTWYLDADNDGHYVSSQSSCSSPGAGYNATATISGDCNDNDPNKWRSTSLYVDADGDGYTVGAATSVCYGATIPAGYRSTSLGVDCNDNNASIHPGATEIADGLDNDCNGTIDDGFINLSIADVSKSEGNKGKSNMTFTVTLNKVTTKKVTVQFATQNGTAIAGSDFTSATGTLTFKAGTTAQTINVSITGDKIVEPNETFKVNLSNAVNAVIVKSSATGTILNDDGVAITSSASNKVSVKSINESADPFIKIAPNPATNILNVDLTGFSGSVTLQLISLHGKMLQQEKIRAVANYVRKQMNISGMASGTYLITVIDEKANRKTEKVVIAH